MHRVAAGVEWRGLALWLLLSLCAAAQGGDKVPAQTGDHAVAQNRDPALAPGGNPATAQSANHKVLIRDVASVEGIRDNSLIGYGLVVGLKGTGDKQ